jgi:hypothetical protein
VLSIHALRCRSEAEEIFGLVMLQDFLVRRCDRMVTFVDDDDIELVSIVLADSMGQ